MNERQDGSFGGPHAGVFNTAFCDGSVRPVCSRVRQPEGPRGLDRGLIDACTKHGFDSADFDYEYPETMQQRADFETCLTDLRAAAPQRMPISVAVSACGTARHLVPAAAAPALDSVCLMVYGPATIEWKTRHAVEKGAGGGGWWYIGLDCQDERSVMAPPSRHWKPPPRSPDFPQAYRRRNVLSPHPEAEIERGSDMAMSGQGIRCDGVRCAT